MTKEERDAVLARCASIDNIIISMEREINMLRTHLDKLTKVCEDDLQMETPYACTQCPYHEQCSAEDWRSCRYDYVSGRYIEPQESEDE